MLGEEERIHQAELKDTAKGMSRFQAVEIAQELMPNQYEYEDSDGDIRIGQLPDNEIKSDEQRIKEIRDLPIVDQIRVRAGQRFAGVEARAVST